MENTAFYEILKNSPQELLTLESVQQSMKKVVLRLVSKGMLDFVDVDDVIQELNELLLKKKLADIQRNYQPEFGQFLPYFERCVYNKSMDILTKISNNQLRTIEFPEAIEALSDEEESMDENIFLHEELRKLGVYFSLFHDKRAKLKLLFQLYARICLIEPDFRFYCNNIPSRLLEALIESFGVPYHQLRDKEVYEEIKPLIELVENKKITSDALRKWINERAEELIGSLNKGKYHYDKESLKNLMQFYFRAGLVPDYPLSA